MPAAKVPAYPDLAPALLVYADLVATGDERNLKTAQLLYDRYFAREGKHDVGQNGATKPVRSQIKARSQARYELRKVLLR